MTYVNLSVPDLFDVCIERCETTQLECILSCENDLMCLSQCISEATSCIEGKFRNLFYFYETLWCSKGVDFNFRLSLSNQLLRWLRGLSQSGVPVWRMFFSAYVFIYWQNSFKFRTWNLTQIGSCVLIIMEWESEDVFMLVREMKIVNLIVWLDSKLGKWTVLVKLVFFQLSVWFIQYDSYCMTHLL